MARDVRVLRWAYQLVVLAAAIAVVAYLVGNVRTNSRTLGIPTGFDYLDNPAQFPIPDTDFRPTQPVREALVIALGNTLRVALGGIVAATVLGTVVGVARLSGNWLVRSAARLYVEVLRNVPLLLVIIFCYLSVALTALPRVTEAWRPLGLAILSNRGVLIPWYTGRALVWWGGVLLAALAAWAVARLRRQRAEAAGIPPGRPVAWAGAAALVVLVVAWFVAGMGVSTPDLDGNSTSGGIRMSPEFFAVFLALVIYTASHIAEIVRGSVQAVAKGQTEAALALALSPWQRLRHVVLPQAFRIAIPPLGNQYLNLLKNSTLGATVSYVELARVTSLSVGNGAPAVPSYLLMLAIFLGLSLVLSLLVNLTNRRLAVPGR